MELAKDTKEEDKLYRYNGVLYPVIMSPVENLKAMERLEARADDVMLVAYPKCGKSKIFECGITVKHLDGHPWAIGILIKHLHFLIVIHYIAMLFLLVIHSVTIYIFILYLIF
jgi:hypothetical protein